MASQSFDGDSIGPKMSLDDVMLPPHVGARAATLYRREDRFATAGEWVTEIGAAAAENTGRAPTQEDLCTVDDGKHSVEVGSYTQSYVCVLDPLGVPFLRGEPGTITSETPVDGETVTVEITETGVNSDTDDAVVSLGVSREVDPGGAVTPEVIYQESCPYIHLFASADEYDRWTDEVDASTTSVTVPRAVALVREMADELFETAE